MLGIFSVIRACKGVKEKNRVCWGLKADCIKPVVLPCSEPRPEVMVVTEQPNIPIEEPNPYRYMLEYLEKCQKRGRDGTAPIIDEMFGGGFLRDCNPKDIRHPFRKLYWTHFIKCPGNIRQRRKFPEKRYLNKNACADRHLCKEIEELKPRLIICMGSLAGKWFLRRIERGIRGFESRYEWFAKLFESSKEKSASEVWMEAIWRELEMVAKGFYAVSYTHLTLPTTERV